MTVLTPTQQRRVDIWWRLTPAQRDYDRHIARQIPFTAEEHAVEITDEEVSAAVVRGMVDGLSITRPGEREVSR